MGLLDHTEISPGCLAKNHLDRIEACLKENEADAQGREIATEVGHACFAQYHLDVSFRSVVR